MKIARLDANHKLYISLAVALTVIAIGYSKMQVSTLFMVTWIIFAVVNLSLSWASIFSVHPMEMQTLVKLEDSSRVLISLFVLAAAMASLFGVIILLGSTQHLKGASLAVHILLSIASVICSWAQVHTVFLFRYAHLYYQAGGKSKPESKYVEGLDFPNEKEPDYLDFAYFSFVIGMTFQVSDVEISSKKIRRLALMHSLISFAFNTVIVALSINVISGLMSK